MAESNPILKALGKPQTKVRREDQEVEPGLLKRIGNTALSGLAKVANFLDLPGSFVRDSLSLENPLDQFMTPFSDQNRTSGRQLLRNIGAVGPVDTTANWWAGLGAEILTDPLTVIGPGGLLKNAVGAGIKGTKAALPAGQGLLKFAVPFAKSTSSELLTGPAARAMAQRVASAAEYTGKSLPARLGRSMLDSSVMGRITPEGQELGQKLFQAQGEAQTSVFGLTGRLARGLETTSRADTAGAKELRRALELPHLGTTKEAQELSGVFALTKAANDTLGLPANDLIDKIPAGKLGYAPRQLNEELRKVKAAEQIGGPLAARSSRDKARLQLLKGFSEGTEGVNKLFADSDIANKATTWTTQWEQARAAGASTKDLAKLKKDAVDDIANEITNKHGTQIVRQYQPEKGAKKLWQDPTGKQKVWAKTAPNGYTPVMEDRYKGLGSLIFDSPEWLEHSIFPNHPLVDAEQYLLSAGNRQAAGEALYGAIAKHAEDFASASLDDTISVGKIIGTLGFQKQKALQQVAARLNIPWGKGVGSQINKMRVPKEIADDLIGLWPQYQVPKETGLLLNTIDSFQSLFKAGVLTWPARFVRDAMSGAARNVENGWLDGKAFVDAHNLLQGREVKGLKDVRVIRDWLATNNMPINDANATEAARQLYAQHASAGHAATDVTSASMPSVDPSLEGILGRIPGRVPTTEAQSIKKVGKMIVGREPGTDLNPLHVRGVNGQLQSTFGPTAAGDAVGKYTDTLNRLSPFLYKLRKGEDPARAMAEITAAQTDYSARAFTPHERVLKRLFPFYSFSKSQIGYVAKELLSNPGGRLRQTIRATSESRGEDATVPDYIGQSASIPLGETADGSRRFVTGFGLMHEDPLGFFGSPQNMLLEAASRLNPLLKAPLEYATGQSFFQHGQDGGRPIGDLDPTIGRILANVTGSKRPVEFPLSREVEMLAGNSPAARLLTTARTATDPRKDVLTKASNLLTGVRITDISPQASDKAMLEQASALIKASGGRVFEDTYFPSEALEAMSPSQRELASKLQELKQLLGERRKQRRLAQQ